MQTTIPTSNGGKVTADISLVPGFDKPWCLVEKPGTDDEFVTCEFATFAAAHAFKERHVPDCDVMKRRPDGSLTAEF